MRAPFEASDGDRGVADPAVGAVVPHHEVLAFVERHALMGRGIGWVDAHLLASTLVAGRVTLWSNDKRLAAAAAERGVAHAPG